MEDTLTPGPEDPGQPAEAGQPAVCANCGQPRVEGDHPTPLCGECREKFIRFPIPRWIWAFAAVILALVVFGLFTMPADLSLGIHLEKGRKASEEKRYMTAERELKAVVAKFQGNTEVDERLLIAAYYNEDFELFSEQVGKLEHRNVKEDELYEETNQILSEAELLVPSDPFKVFTDAHPVLDGLADTAWQNYFHSNPDDNNARIIYVGRLFDQKQYLRADSVIGLVLAAKPGSIAALMLAASVKRERGQYDSALTYNQRILAVNNESVSGLASEARTLLRQKADARALEVALQGYKLDEKESYAQASLILAYHFNGRAGDRDALIKKALQAAKDSSDKTNLQYALDVISKKEKFRD